MITDGTDPIPALAPKRSTTKAVILVLAVLALAGTVIIVLATRGGDDGDRVEFPLGGAANACGESGGMVNGDGGRTLTMDTAGEDAGSGEVDILDAVCALAYLDTPDSVMDHIEATRALDGMQTASWDRFTARWTYHPDSGLDITITDDGGS